MADGQRSLNIDMVAPFSSSAITQKNPSASKVRNVVYDTLMDFGDNSDKISSAVR
ncbi:hypothetical protein [Sodalis glossinidius]|uniref:fimbrial biogenesis chaperone n=1 Tax=Sodalis glossinidius TaxID=63612 RepID=UPI0011D060FB